jgi:hypothetical protein
VHAGPEVGSRERWACRHGSLAARLAVRQAIAREDVDAAAALIGQCIGPDVAAIDGALAELTTRGRSRSDALAAAMLSRARELVR